MLMFVRVYITTAVRSPAKTITTIAIPITDGESIPPNRHTSKSASPASTSAVETATDTTVIINLFI